MYSFHKQKIDVIEGSGGHIVLFKISEPDNIIFSQNNYSVGDRFELTLSSGDYSLIETGDLSCTNYSQCKNSIEFVNESIFSVSGGITLNKSIYGQEESVIISAQGPTAGNPFQVYDFSSDSFLWGGTSYSYGDKIDVGLPVGSYSILETSDYNCFYLSYLDCKNSPDFLKEVSFNIVSPGGGGSPEELSSVGFLDSPSIDIFSPKEGDLFSKEIPILYSVNNIGDNYGEVVKNKYGLINNPISMFLLDQFIDYDQIDVFNLSKFLIAKDLPADGKYQWLSKNLTENRFYRILIMAKNRAGLIGKKLSGYFNIDFTEPTFIVTVSPAVAKNEYVKIKILSSEILTESPKVFVRQHNALPTKVEVYNSGVFYEGDYKVVNGFDGTATIEVSGIDHAGNRGSLIVGGGTFSVGINPPEKPIVLNLNNNQKVNSENISIKGKSRDDTTVLIKVNGQDSYKGAPNLSGDFVIDNIYLNKNKKNGLNVLNIISKDKIGNLSEAVTLNVFYNISPVLTVIEPKPNDLVSGIFPISTMVSDDNNDLITLKYEIAPNSVSKNLDWQSITDTPSLVGYLDTTKLSDGDYVIRVRANDGINETLSESINVRIKNETSFFIRFYGGLHVVVNKSIAKVRGVVYAQKNPIFSPTVRNLKYSVDNGVSYITVPALDGSFDSAEERFEVDINNLKEGVNNIIWKTTDSRNFTITSEQPITVDTLSPQKPEIVFPENNSILTSLYNETTDKKNFSFSVRGRAEPGTTIVLKIDNREFTSQSMFDGNFKVSNINLLKNGKYTIEAFTIDNASNTSPVLKSSFIYNNPPEVVFTNPVGGYGVSNNPNISWLVYDQDGDNVTVESLSYRKTGSPSVLLAKNLKKNEFAFNPSSLSSGKDYELILNVNDGISSLEKRYFFTVDRQSPLITKLNIKNNNPTDIIGHAVDRGSWIRFVEYSLTSKDNLNKKSNDLLWYKTDLAYLNSNNNDAEFRIEKLPSVNDGVYTLSVRAIDSVGNISKEESATMLIDNTSPRVGSFELYDEDKQIVPIDNVWPVSIGKKIQIKISMEGDTNSVFLFFAKEKIILNKDIYTGLWVGEFYVKDLGVLPLVLSATDNVGNTLKDHTLINLESKFNVVSPEIESSEDSWWNFIFHMLKFI